MLARIAAFEVRYQLRAPLFYVGFALFFLLTFGSVTVDEIQIGGKGNVNVNSPFAIALCSTTKSKVIVPYFCEWIHASITMPSTIQRVRRPC